MLEFISAPRIPIDAALNGMPDLIGHSRYYPENIAKITFNPPVGLQNSHLVNNTFKSLSKIQSLAFLNYSLA